MSDFLPLTVFENLVADYFGSKYALAVDSCTNGLELALRVTNADKAICPLNTYISVPMMLTRANIDFNFEKICWAEYYHLTPRVIDAAVLWKQNSFVPNTIMCISFHFKKHLNLGRGGMILLDDEALYDRIKRLRYDGRNIYDGISYNTDFDINEIGYHYYMTPEEATLGISKFVEKRDAPAKVVTYQDYPDLTNYKVFNEKNRVPRAF